MEFGNVCKNFSIKSGILKNTIISGYASVFNYIDNQNDIVEQGAFSAVKVENIKLLWQHDMSKPIGKIKSIYEDEYGLKIEAEINNNIEQGKEAAELIKQKAIAGLSVGFSIGDFAYNDSGVRLIKKANLIEISIVTFPANEKAGITEIKAKKFNNKNEVYMEENTLNLISKNIQTIMDSELKSTEKIKDLETKFINLQNDIYAPDSYNYMNNEETKAFGDYLRKGTKSEIIIKSLSSDAGEAGVAVVNDINKEIIKAVNTKSLMRQLASIETISSSALDLILEDGNFASGWVSEIEERRLTDTPKLVKKTITAHELYAQPKATQKLVDDSAIDINSWLVEKIADSFIKLENLAFIDGDGNKKPFGILKNNDIKKIDTGNSVTPDILLKLISELSEEHLANACFLMNRTTLALIQNLRDENGRFIWQQSLSDPLNQTIFGIPVFCSAHMPNVGENNLAIAIGDFKTGYKIVDRSQIGIMRDPYTEKPFIKFYAVKRVGGDVIFPNAIKFAKFSA